MSELKVGHTDGSKVNSIISSGLLNNAPRGATHFDTFWMQFLKKCGDNLFVWENDWWHKSNHKDGSSMLSNGECINLWTKELEQGVNK